MSQAANAACPSAPAAAGARLIGIVQPDGRIANLPTALTVDEDFIERAKPHGPLESRFRFTAPCQKAGCTHWTGHACGLVGAIIRGAAHDNPPSRPPPCAIRAICRWWDQEGPVACAACTLVVTDTRVVALEGDVM